MRLGVLLALFALSGCFIGDEFYEPTDDELRGALVSCGFSGVQINPRGEQPRIDFGNVPRRDRAKHECFENYMRERDWFASTSGQYEYEE